MEKNRRETPSRKEGTEPSRCQVKRIDILPDDILLEFFYFYVVHGVIPDPSLEDNTGIETWQTLVHVCRRWRSLVFQSPRRLNLRLVCTPETSLRDTLDIWPALPLIVRGLMALSLLDTDNIIEALGQSNRICQVIIVDLLDWQFEQVLAAMQVSFPELTDLRLSSFLVPSSVIPDPGSFLGGSAPRLQYVSLSGIPFPGLPNLLLSATHLVQLRLSEIDHSGYISPEAMGALLSVLSSLELLSLQFLYSESRPFPDWESPRLPPPRRSVLPALDTLHFEGVIKYLEDLVTFIDAPQLKFLNVTFFNQIDLDCGLRLAQFINRTPSLRALNEARVHFDDSSASVRLRYRTSESSFDDLVIRILCEETDLQLLSIARVCNSFLPSISTVEDLYIDHRYLFWMIDTIENTMWLLSFTAVKNLYLSKELAPRIAAVLQEFVGSRITEVLPSLQNIFVEELDPSGPFQENIRPFVAARQCSDHPIAISNWDK